VNDVRIEIEYFSEYERLAKIEKILKLIAKGVI
jgi:hypothetical protein